MSASFKPISFEQWRAQQLSDDCDPQRHVECIECLGTCIEECAECGHEGDCAACDGDGYVIWEDLTEGEKASHLSRDRYNKAVLNDANAWAKWLGVDPVATLVAAGFRVWSSVASHTLQIAPMAEAGAA